MELLGYHVGLPAVAAAAAGAVVTSVVWGYLTSPRLPAGIPGPFLAKLSSRWILFVDLAGARARTVQELHKKYGPVVQVGPNELSFSSIEAVKPIYGPGTTCIKSSAYDMFGRLGIFQMQDPEMHRQRQKRVAHIFSQGTIKQMEPFVQAAMVELTRALGKRTGKPVDALHWTRMTALDISGDILLGKSFGALAGDGEAPAYVHHLDNAYLVWSLNYLAPTFCRLLELLPFQGLRNFMAAGDYVYTYGDNATKEYIELYGRKSVRRSLLTKIIAGDPATGAEPLSDGEISVEVSNLVFAATDTTGNTMAYALYRLCCHPEWQAKLRQEIRISTAERDDFAYQTVQALPVLNGIVMETLRLHPAAPSALPRVTTGDGCTIAGMHVPGKTLVSMQALTTQRDPALFPDPDAFDPARWIAADGTASPGTAEVREMMFVWGKGSRACLGQYMATMEIKVLLARLVGRFAVALAGPQTHDDMEMTDHFTLIPKGKRCGLVFTEASG